ncbi:MAG: type I glutamate--ammonia ligase [Candidatus Gastranaerophilales bacterium]|nr:type I glutamate--ammonia ligase [Candidatus Gastranaerophilales bacterium]
MAKTNYTEDDIKKIIKDKKVEFIKLQFCDINGQVKNLSVPSGQIDKILNNEIMLDGSSIKGFRNIETSDMYFYPDLSTFTLLPFREDKVTGTNVARLICDIYNPDGTPFEGCPRANLKRVMQKAKKLGYEMNVGPEAEFFIFKRDENGQPSTQTHDRAGYYDAAPDDLGENLRKQIVRTITAMGFEVEASHHEVAQGQHEIDFKYEDALTSADNIITFRYVVKALASLNGTHATFMPKPIYGINGSGMHCNLSLFKNGKNTFFDSKRAHQLSETALYAIGGLLNHVKHFTAITNPIVNSYKRLVPGYEAPVYLAWSLANRSALIRVPAKRGNATRVELRSPDPSCNPYLALAVILESILDGVQNKIQPPLDIDKNIFKMDDKERKRAKIETLPGSLYEALMFMKKSAIVKSALGEHIFKEFMQSKLKEWDGYRTSVSPYELNLYLERY